MFERFTEKAIKAIMISQEESRRLGHNFVGTEQILLGLIGEGTGVAAKALAFMGVKLKETRIEVEKIVGRGSGIVAVEIPFTPRTKRVLELSVQEANQEGVNYVGTEHLLLGLIRAGDGVGVKVLKNLGVDLLKVRTQVMRMLNKDIKDQTCAVLGRPVPTLSPETKTYYLNILRETHDLYKKNLADLKLELARRGYSVEINRQIEHYIHEISKIEKEFYELSTCE